MFNEKVILLNQEREMLKGEMEDVKIDNDP